MDIAKPDEIVWFDMEDDVRYIPMYTVTGHIEIEDKCEINVGEFRVVIDNDYIPNEQTEPYFVVTIYDMYLPWVLEEPMSEETTMKNNDMMFKTAFWLTIVPCVVHIIIIVFWAVASALEKPTDRGEFYADIILLSIILAAISALVGPVIEISRMILSTISVYKQKSGWKGVLCMIISILSLFASVFFIYWFYMVMTVG